MGVLPPCKGGFTHFLGLVVTEYIPGLLVWSVLPNSSRKGASSRFPEGIPGIPVGPRTFDWTAVKVACEMLCGLVGWRVYSPPFPPYRTRNKVGQIGN